MKDNREQKFASILFVIIVLIIWQFISFLEIVSPLLLASPFEIAKWIVLNILNYQLWVDVGVTLRRVFISLIFSAFIGVPTGLLMGYFRILEKVFILPVDFSRSIPATALFPLFILFFGSGEAPRVAAAIYGASLIILMNTMSGVKQSNLARIAAARAYGAKGLKLFLNVLLPEALPSIITGFRLALSLSFVIIVLVEMFIGTSAGLGHRIINAQLLYEIPQMYASIVITGIIGYILNLFFALMESRITHYVGY